MTTQIHPSNPSLWRRAYDSAKTHLVAQIPNALEATGKHAAKLAKLTTDEYKKNGGGFTKALSNATKQHLGNVFSDVVSGGKKALLYAGEELPVVAEAAIPVAEDVAIVALV